MKMHTYIIEDLNRFIVFIKIKLLNIKLSCQNKQTKTFIDNLIIYF